jgi:hypothetical protein
MNELEMRTFVRQILEVLRKGASLTGTTIDDQTIDMVLRAVDSDLIWSWVFALIQRFLKDEPILVESGVEVAEACEVAAISPLAIIAIIKAMVELWKLLKKEQA